MAFGYLEPHIFNMIPFSNRTRVFYNQNISGKMLQYDLQSTIKTFQERCYNMIYNLQSKHFRKNVTIWFLTCL